MNDLTLVGRLTKDPELKEGADGKIRTVVNLAVSRGYKNADGIYETDFINCVLWNGIASATSEYCHKGDVIGVKGRLKTYSYEADDKTKKYGMDVVADRVVFISPVKRSEKEVSKA